MGLSITEEGRYIEGTRVYIFFSSSFSSALKYDIIVAPVNMKTINIKAFIEASNEKWMKNELGTVLRERLPSRFFFANDSITSQSSSFNDYCPIFVWFSQLRRGEFNRLRIPLADIGPSLVIIKTKLNTH